MASRVLPKAYAFAGSTWRTAADAIAHADTDRKDAADALVTHADKGDARAQGRLLGMLEATSRTDADDDDSPALSFARELGEARGDSASSRMDSLAVAAADARARKLNPKAHRAAASK